MTLSYRRVDKLNTKGVEYLNMSHTRNNPKRHLYEVVYIFEDGKDDGRIYEVGTFLSEKAGEEHSLSDAKQVMGDAVEIDAVKIYHTHPSPGPTRRYVGIVRRGDWTIARPQ